MSLRQNRHRVSRPGLRFSYQSECHCAKTEDEARAKGYSLVTSQNVTAPKHVALSIQRIRRLVTSQNVTAPKQLPQPTPKIKSLVTSQNVTAPKQWQTYMQLLASLVTSQNVTTPKQKFSRVNKKSV